MNDIKITVRNKIAAAPIGTVVVGSNTSYRIVFDFDDEWSQGIKTARFSYGDNYIDVPFSGSTVNLPIIDGVTLLHIGIYEGNLSTSTPATIKMKPSIRAGGSPQTAPTPDVYQQLISLINEKSENEPVSNGYNKPDGGIPKTDLDAEVQLSLSKADTAIQPENGKSLFSGSYNDLTNKPTIPSAVTESTVSDWGFTKNIGTVTGIKMNGISKGSTGIVDLGTVLTEHQNITDKSDKPTFIVQNAPTTIALADNTVYEFTDVSSLVFTYPQGRYNCYIKLTTASNGAVTVTLPASQYIGVKPTFANGETWEISIMNGIVVAGKAEAMT